MTVVDAEYKFLFCSIGSEGSASDGGMFRETTLNQALKNGYAGLPPTEPLPHDDACIPYFLVGDEAFGLRTWMMKPYSCRHLTRSERIFNYRLSRAIRVVEDAFGILVSRFRVFFITMCWKSKTIEDVVTACCILHNLLIDRNVHNIAAEVDQEKENGDIIPGTWRQEEDIVNWRGIVRQPGPGWEHLRSKASSRGTIWRGTTTVMLARLHGRIGWRSHLSHMMGVVRMKINELVSAASTNVKKALFRATPSYKRSLVLIHYIYFLLNQFVYTSLECISHFF